jgi:hypothetical protein
MIWKDNPFLAVHWYPGYMGFRPIENGRASPGIAPWHLHLKRHADPRMIQSALLLQPDSGQEMMRFPIEGYYLPSIGLLE